MPPRACRVRWCVVTAVLSLAAGSAGAQVRLTYQDMLDHLTNLDRLPVIEPGVTCGQASSYDRRSKYDEAADKYIDWDANGDAGHFIRVEPDGEGVMAELEGPGCIFRIWSANPQGVIRFYLDGDTKPTHEFQFHKLFTGVIDPFIEPLVWHRDKNNPDSSAHCSLPIPYAKSCKVTSIIINQDGKKQKPWHYYIINYRTFPKDWQVESFRRPLSPEDQKALRTTANRWAGGRDEEYKITTRTVQPGETLVLQELTGPATVKAFRLKLKSAEKWAARKVMLKVWWDGEERPSVDCPINDFFGEPRDFPYRSYPMQIAEDINTCYFPMPFRKSAKIAVVNEGRQPAEIHSSFGYVEGQVPENVGYFHAKYRQEKAGTAFDYPLIEATGTGKLVGICLYPDNIHGGWWGEGDEKVYVDGEKFPSWFGTGTEDFFGDAWGIRYFENPVHGHPDKQIERMQGCYRWLLGDNIPFYRSLRMTMENYAALPSEKVKNDYYSVAYWYQLPGGSDFFKDVPVEERIPRGFVAQDAIEAEDALLKPAPAGMAVVSDRDLPEELSRNRGVKLTGKVGDTFVFTLPAPADGRYIPEVVAAKGVKASTFEFVSGDSKPMAKYFELKKGDNIVGLRFTGQPVEAERCELIVDYFIVDPYRDMITEWLWIGPFPSPGGKGLDAPFPPETEMAPAKKYAGRDGQEVSWKRIARPGGMMMVHQLLEPRENCVLYAAVIVHAPAAGKYELLTGSDDGLKVFLNGQVVYEKKIMRGLKADDDRINVELKAGDNLLLLKVQQDGGDAGFAARFIDRDSKLTYALPK